MKSITATAVGFAAIAVKSGANIHFEPARYGAELHPVARILAIPS
jgi:hypothetical protein